MKKHLLFFFKHFVGLFFLAFLVSIFFCWLINFKNGYSLSLGVALGNAGTNYGRELWMTRKKKVSV